jgi:hypothetical protein
MQETPPLPSPLLGRSTFFVRERVAFMKLTDAYDILDPVTGAQLGLAKEEPKSAWLRLLINKQLLPTTVVVYEADGQTVALRIEKPFTFWRTRLSVYDAQGRFLGLLSTKMFSFKRQLIVEDANERPVGSFSGKWPVWPRSSSPRPTTTSSPWRPRPPRVRTRSPCFWPPASGTTSFTPKTDPHGGCE